MIGGNPPRLLAYGLDDGILACVDLETGKHDWKGGRYGHGQVLLSRNWLLVQAENGDVVAVESNPSEWHELSRLHCAQRQDVELPDLER